jgi:hypothetical protein
MGNKIKADISKMTLGEQALWETLTGDRLHKLGDTGLTGKRLAALIFIFAKRQDPAAKFDDYLNLNMDEASELLGDDDEDPKEQTA